MQLRNITVKYKIYLDSTVPNYVFNDDYPEKQKAAKELFALATTDRTLMFISPVTVEEISRSAEPRRSKMLELLKVCTAYQEAAEAELIALKYIKNRVFSKNNLDDARHVAYAVYYRADIIASYNFSHIVRFLTITKLQAANLVFGFQTPEIRSPEELL